MEAVLVGLFAWIAMRLVHKLIRPSLCQAGRAAHEGDFALSWLELATVA